MRLSPWCCAVLVAASAAAGADDRIGNSKAPEIFKKTGADLAKRQGAKVTEKLTVPGFAAPGTEQSYEGVMKKDFAALKGTMDAWLKGAATVVRNGSGKFVEPKDLDPQLGAQAASIRNPALVAAAALRFGATATWTGDEKVGEDECRIAETVADARSMEEQLKDFVKNIKLPKEAGNMDITQFVDKKKSSSSYKVWIARETLHIRKVEWTLSLVIDKGKIPPFGGIAEQVPAKLDVKCELGYQEWDGALDVEVPREIKARFGLK